MLPGGGSQAQSKLRAPPQTGQSQSLLTGEAGDVGFGSDDSVRWMNRVEGRNRKAMASAGHREREVWKFKS